MSKVSDINKKAWEYRAYEYWLRCNGSPQHCADYIKSDPMLRLKNHRIYFQNVAGLKIANPCGSCGGRAVALALLGAEVTIFDISQENKRYALELAQCAGVQLNYVLGDFYGVDLSVYENYFHMVYLEGGVLHYFHDIDKLMDLIFRLLKSQGKIVLSDFHPFRKVMPINCFECKCKDYFNCDIVEEDLIYKSFFSEEEQKDFPKCALRLYTLSEIINALIKAGFTIKEFNEGPSWSNKRLPGEFTIFAVKE